MPTRRGVVWYSHVVLAGHVPPNRTRPPPKNQATTRYFPYGSDGTRTRDLRRDRPAL
jgi:hypothetical protein